MNMARCDWGKKESRQRQSWKLPRPLQSNCESRLSSPVFVEIRFAGSCLLLSCPTFLHRPAIEVRSSAESATFAHSQVLTQCMRTRDENGGLLDLRQCLANVRRARPGEKLALEDLERAVECLAQSLGRIGCAFNQATHNIYSYITTIS